MKRLMKKAVLAPTLMLGLFVMSASSARAAVLEILSVKCIAPQERDSNGDELRLRLSPKGAARKEFTRSSVRAGVVWNPGAKVVFHGSIQIELHEIDSFPSLTPGDELLGSATFGETPRSGKLTFNRHGSHYEVSYRIIPDKAFVVRLISLKCIAPQERDAQGDELKLSFKRDSDLSATTLNFTGVRAGREIFLNRTVHFHTKVSVQLSEVDSVGLNPFSIATAGDENLGQGLITTSAGTRTIVFNRHGAHYVLRYTVTKE